MNHKGYTARIEFDADDDLFYGRIIGIDDVVGFHGETVEELRTNFQDAVDNYLAMCAKVGKKPERAFSGKVMLRLAPELHARIAKSAEMAGLSLNQWGEQVFKQATQ